MNKEIELLNKKIEAQDKIINTQALEIARLKEDKKKAIEYIELWHYRNDYRVNSFTKGVKEDLLKILGDKENE